MLGFTKTRFTAVSKNFVQFIVFGLAIGGVARISQAGPMHPLVIYGEDNRLDLYEEKDASKLEVAKTVVAIISARDMKVSSSGVTQLTNEKLGEIANLCPDEKFFNQPAPAYCSGFLVADNIVATAGHCVQDYDFCKDARFVFDFAMDSKNADASLVKSDNVYGCKRVIYDEMRAKGSDFALVELDRKVVGRTPVKFAASVPKPGDSIYVVGHPVGLPIKIAGGASVRRNAKEYFVANLDTFGGNSGSAVFVEGTNEVAGILVRGEQDFMRNGSCNVSFRCAEGLCRGEDVTNGDRVAEKLLDILTTPDEPTPSQVANSVAHQTASEVTNE